jgi:hypothetical protein
MQVSGDARILVVLLSLLGGCAHYDYVGGCIQVEHVKRTAPGVGRAFRRLVAAAMAAPITQLDEQLLAVNPAELHAAAMGAFTGAPRALRRFADQASSRENLRHFAASMACSRVVTSARSKIEVRLWTWRGPITLKSESENALRAPWTVTRGRTSIQTCNPEIQRALAALFRLPRSRSDSLVEEIVWDAQWQYGKELATNSATEWLGDQLEPIRSRFPIRSMEVREEEDKPGEELPLPGLAWSDPRQPGVLTVLLQPPQLGRVALALKLNVRDGRIDPRPFVASFDAVAARVARVAWLHSFLAANPEAMAEIELRGGDPPTADWKLHLNDGRYGGETWRHEAQGLSVLESAGDIPALKAVPGDAFTDEGELMLGPGHRWPPRAQ